MPRDTSNTTLTRAEQALGVLHAGGTLTGKRLFPGAWSHTLAEKPAEGKLPIPDDFAERNVQSMAQKGWIRGRFVDLGENRHELRYELTEDGQAHAATLFAEGGTRAAGA